MKIAEHSMLSKQLTSTFLRLSFWTFLTFLFSCNSTENHKQVKGKLVQVQTPV